MPDQRTRHDLHHYSSHLLAREQEEADKTNSWDDLVQRLPENPAGAAVFGLQLGEMLYDQRSQQEELRSMNVELTLCPASAKADLFSRRHAKLGRIFVEGDTEDQKSFEIELLWKRRINKIGGKPFLE